MSTAIKYRADIDGLRAFAILSVFIFHLNPSWLYGGFIGVDVFFVISGYLITRIIIRENQQGNFSFVNFYARRVKRIFPVLFFVLAVVAIMAILSFPDVIYKTFEKSFRYASVQFSNFFFAKEVDYFAEGNELQPLLHTWSLAVEEQFYLVWPFLIFLCYKLAKTEKRNAILFVFFAVMSLSFFTGYVLAYKAPQYAFYMFFSRAWEFCIGGIFALDLIPNIKNKRVNNLTAVLSFVLMIASFIFIREGVDFVKGAVIVPVVGAGLIIYTAQQDETWISRMLSLKPVVYLGLISYSMYLWHWPVIVFYKELFDAKELSYGISLILVVITVILSLISYYLIEQPARKLKLKNGFTLLLGALFISSFIASSFWLKKQSQAKWRVNYSQPYRLTGLSHCLVGKNSKERTKEYLFENCIFGKNKSKVEILLIGDSHIGNYGAAVIRWAKKNRHTVLIAGEHVCPINVHVSEKIDSKRSGCKEISKVIASIIEENKDIKYIIWAQYWNRYARIDKGFNLSAADYVNFIKDNNKIPILLGQVPILEHDPRQVCQRPILNFKDNLCEILKPSPDKTPLFLTDLATKEGIVFFEPENFISSGKDDNGEILYFDDDHLNDFGAEYVAPYFIEFMEKEFGDESN